MICPFSSTIRLYAPMLSYSLLPFSPLFYSILFHVYFVGGKFALVSRRNNDKQNTTDETPRFTLLSLIPLTPFISLTPWHCVFGTGMLLLYVYYHLFSQLDKVTRKYFTNWQMYVWSPLLAFSSHLHNLPDLLQTILLFGKCASSAPPVNPLHSVLHYPIPVSPLLDDKLYMLFCKIKIMRVAAGIHSLL